MMTRRQGRGLVEESHWLITMAATTSAAPAQKVTLGRTDRYAALMALDSSGKAKVSEAMRDP
ncbi:MAG TPA: hypothetical protein VGE39_16465, partial [Prosthecobacter sp.]